MKLAFFVLLAILFLALSFSEAGSPPTNFVKTSTNSEMRKGNVCVQWQSPKRPRYTKYTLDCVSTSGKGFSQSALTATSHCFTRLQIPGMIEGKATLTCSVAGEDATGKPQDFATLAIQIPPQPTELQKPIISYRNKMVKVQWTPGSVSLSMVVLNLSCKKTTPDSKGRYLPKTASATKTIVNPSTDISISVAFSAGYNCDATLKGMYVDQTTSTSELTITT